MDTKQIETRLHAFSQRSANDKSTYRPHLFRLARDDDREAVADLLDENRRIRVYDELAAQLAVLMETRNPQATLDSDTIDQRVKQHLNGESLSRYGVWAYYPWSCNLVHILDEAEFVELRTSRNLYKITMEEQATLAEKTIGVVGLSAGQSIAVTMAIERSYGEIRLADFDTLDLTNMNRLRSGLHELSLSKVVIAAREIAEIDPYLRVRCFTDGLSRDNIDDFLLGDGKLSILIDECDSLDIKFLCRRRARELGIPVVMDTSDRGMIDVERFDTEPDRPLFHGLVPDLPPSELCGLSTEEKVPFVLSILGRDTLSTRLRASLLEVGNSVPTWPQLATSVALGGAVAGDVCRRILLDSFRDSGRYYVDPEQLIHERDTVDPKRRSRGNGQAATHCAGSVTLTPDVMTRLADTALAASSATSIQLDGDRLEQVVEAATFAPSGGNVQPWKWMHRATRLWLFHDRASDTLLDFGGHGSHIALGAAAENLVLEAHRLGLEVSTAEFPLADDDRLAAGFAFQDGKANNGSTSVEPHVCDELVDYLRVRLTNRELGPRVSVPSCRLAP